jgi:hypothetical protein
MKAIATASALLLLLTVCWTAADARPAPWYKWRSKVDGSTTCSQVQLGPGWEKDGGPFRDSRCEKPILAK